MKKSILFITLFCSLFGVNTNMFTSALPQDPLNCGTMDYIPLPTHITTRAVTYLGAAMPALYGAEVLYSTESTRMVQALGVLGVAVGIKAVKAIAHRDLKYRKERKEYEQAEREREQQAEETRALQEACKKITGKDNPRPGGIRLQMSLPTEK